MYVYMYICIHVYMYISIYVYIYISIYVYMYICIYTSIYTSFRIYVTLGLKPEYFTPSSFLYVFHRSKVGGECDFFCFGKPPNVHIHIYTHSVFEPIKCMKPRVLSREMPWPQKNSSLCLGSV